MLFDKMTFMGYDGETERLLTIPEKRDIIYNMDSKYILVQRVGITNKARESGIFQSLKEEYDELIINVNNLKKETKGIINFYKTGTVKNTALELFDRMSKFILNPDKIDEEETTWIRGASSGALTYCNKGFEGSLYKYDYVSMYPYILKSVAMMPVKKGEFKTISQDEFESMKYIQYGIYRCIVTSDLTDNMKLFKLNASNYYTHTSLNDARDIGLKIEMIQDDKPNFLYWSRDKLLNFSEIFTDYIDYLFPLKAKKIKYSKDLINILWGALCEVNKKKYYIQNDEVSIPTTNEILSFRPSNTNEDDLIIKTAKTNNFYKSGFARLMPFILSKGRSMMYTILKGNAQHIHKIQTDGFLSDMKLDLKTGLKLGDLRYEGYCENAKINHINDIQGEFVI
jgi:hypothetical protein